MRISLQKESQFNNVNELKRKQDDEVEVSARQTDWFLYLVSGPVASEEFMEGIEELPVNERFS